MTVSRGQIDFDVVVVGASFAGLSFASVASVLGLRVLVVEKDPQIGGIVRTTGVLFSDVLDIIDVPRQYLMNSVRRIHIQPPDRREVEIQSHAYRYYMADVSGMLCWMAEQACERGTTIWCNTLFQGASCESDGMMRVALNRGMGGENGSGGKVLVTTRCLIGADGTHSHVARSMLLGQNQRYLAGAEWLLEGIELDRETFYLIMDQRLAPGYCLWLAPHGDIAALGVAGHAREFSPATSLRIAQEAFQSVADMSKARVVERKGGVIPTGGRLRHVYRDDELGCVLLLGDAAGLCGAATGGGIYPALISGRLAAHAVASHIMDGERNAIPAYLRNLPYAGRLGDYLRIEDWLRWVLDSMKSNDDLTMLYGLFASPEGHRVLQAALLETPIISMDSNFFALLSKLLRRHPRVYRSAVDVLWKRIVLQKGH